MKNYYNKAFSGLFILIVFIFQSCNPEPSCSDGQLNGDETEIDCGGSCPPCYTCEDGIQNQGELGIDCGGPCATCPGEFLPLEFNFHGDQLSFLEFPTKNVGYVSGGYQLYKTVDGGETWTIISPSNSGKPITHLKFYSETLGFVTIGSRFESQEILRTEDGGGTWEPIVISSIYPYLSYFGSSKKDFDMKGNYGTMVLDYGIYVGGILITGDGGKTWIPPAFNFSSSFSIPQNVERVVQINNNTRYIMAEDYIYKGVGSTWTKIDNPFENSDNAFYGIEDNTISFLDENNAILKPNTSANYDFQKTTDGWLSWSPVPMDRYLGLPSRIPVLNHNYQGDVPRTDFVSFDNGYTFFNNIERFNDGTKNQYTFIAETNNGGGSWEGVGYFQYVNEEGVNFDNILDCSDRLDNIYYCITSENIIYKATF